MTNLYTIFIINFTQKIGFYKRVQINRGRFEICPGANGMKIELYWGNKFTCWVLSEEGYLEKNRAGSLDPHNRPANLARR